MARRRINTRLITIGLSTVVVLAGGAVTLYKFHKPRNPQPFIAAGDLAMQQGDYQKAIDNLSIASGMLPLDTSLHLKMGRAYYQMRRGSASNFLQAVSEYTKAEQLNPKSKEAWAGLLEANEYRVEAVEGMVTSSRDRESLPASITMARQAAEHLADLEPDNVDAQAAKSELIIRVWLLNLSMPITDEERKKAPDKQLTPDKRADQAITELTVLMHSHPENEKIPYWIARGKILQAQNALKSDNPGDAAPLFAEAAAQFDANISAKPNVVALYLSKATILEKLIDADPSPATRADYRKSRHQTLEIAQNLADPKNLLQYELAKQEWARDLSATEPTRAEAVYRDLINRFPDELGFRLALAQMLQHQAGRPADALGVLDVISALPGPSVTNAQLRDAWEYQVAGSKLLRADIETDQLIATPPGKARDLLAKDIQASADASRKYYDGTAQLLGVLGRFQLNNGQIRDAIQTLTGAVEKSVAGGLPVSSQLLRDEADAYSRGGQTTTAIGLLETAMKDPSIANNAEIHRTLAQLHIQNQDYARAKPYVDWLLIRYPDVPQIIVLQISALGPPGTNPAAARALYDRLPEKQPNELVGKLGVAVQIQDQDEQLRLLKLMNQASPADSEISAQLAQLLGRMNQVPEANKVLDAAIAANPDNARLKIVKDILNGGSKDQAAGATLAEINKITDPFQRETKLAELYAAEQRPEEQLIHLNAALKLQPDNKNLLQTIFILHMEAKRFADAEAMLPHMAQLDVDDARGGMLKSKLLLAKRDIPDALVTTRQLTHDFPEFAGSWELYGEALRASGQLDSGCQQFTAALDRQPTNLEASKNLILSTVQLGKLDDAKAYIAEARKRFPGDQAYRDLQVQFEILYGDPESIIPSLTDQLKQHPEDRRNYGITADALTAAMHQQALKGNADAAAQYLAQVKDLYQQAVTRWPENLKFANGLQDAMVQSRDYAGAEGVLKAVSQTARWKDQPAPQILLAQLYLSWQKPDLAEASLRQALVDDTHSVAGRLMLADALIAQQKYDEALAVLQPGTSNFEIRVKYTDLLLGINRGAQAEAGLTQALAAEPGNTELTNLLIHVYDAQGKYDRALTAANDALMADHGNVSAYFWRGKVESHGPRADIDAAIKDLNYYRDANPLDADAHLMLAQLHDAKHEREEAIQELQTVIRFSPLDGKTRLMLLRDFLTADPPRPDDAERFLKQTLALPSFSHDPQFEALSALLLAQKGQNDSALATIQDAMKHAPDKSVLLHDYFNVLMLTQNYQLLLDESDQYASNPKTNWIIFNYRGRARASLGDKDGAITEFNTALDRAGNEDRVAGATIVNSITQIPALGADKALQLVLPRAENNIGWKLMANDLYIAKGDLPNALKTVDAMMAGIDKLSPEDQFHMLRQASGLYMTVNPPMPEKAVSIYQKMLAANPDDIEALNDMACVLVDMSVPSKPQEALVWSQHAYELSQKIGHVNPRVYDTQGWVLIQAGRLDDGIDVLHQIVDLADFPDAHYHLAKGYLLKNRPEEAQRELNRASEMVDSKIAAHQIVDATLRPKIDAALKEASEKSGVKSNVKEAS